MTDDPRLGLPSASKMERVCACPGSENLIRKLPPEKHCKDEEEDPLQKRGLRIHKARETGNTLELNADELKLYQDGLKCEENLIARWKEVFSIKEVKEGPRELRLYLHDHSLRPIASGQLDTHWISDTGKHAAVGDYKTGFCSNLVGATGNWQLRLGAVLLNEEYEGLENIRVWFVKPLFEKARLDYVDYSPMDIKFAKDSVLYQLWWATQPDAQRVPGAHCRYCPARGSCPEALAYALLPSTMVKMSKSGRSRVIHVEETVPEDLHKLHKMSGAVRAILDAVNGRLKGMTDDELQQIGLMHGKPRQNSFWTDLKAACHFLTEEKVMFAPEQVWSAMDLSLSPLASILALREGGTEEEAKDKLKSLLAPYLGVKEGEAPIVGLK